MALFVMADMNCTNDDTLDGLGLWLCCLGLGGG